MTPAIILSCDDCVMARTTACEDCLVNFVLGRQPDEALIIDAGEARAVRLLADAGLMPALRHQRAV
ncbi:MAG: hypothetical protein ACYCS7_15480 [Acidimicrobiales bacterium]